MSPICVSPRVYKQARPRRI